MEELFNRRVKSRDGEGAFVQVVEMKRETEYEGGHCYLAITSKATSFEQSQTLMDASLVSDLIEVLQEYNKERAV